MNFFPSRSPRNVSVLEHRIFGYTYGFGMPLLIASSAMEPSGHRLLGAAIHVALAVGLLCMVLFMVRYMTSVAGERLGQLASWKPVWSPQATGRFSRLGWQPHHFDEFDLKRRADALARAYWTLCMVLMALMVYVTAAQHFSWWLPQRTQQTVMVLIALVMFANSLPLTILALTESETES